MIVVSSNQLSTALYKAWRAVGVPVGPAREVGQAAARLATAGPDTLDNAVPPLDFDPERFGPPEPVDGGWRFEPGCAALHGPSVIDLLMADPDGHVTLVELDCVPLLAALFEHRRIDDQPRLTIASESGSDETRVTARSAVGDRAGDVPPVPIGPFEIADETWDRMQALAGRLLVPASEVSRQGAGAGAIDND